jgi:hypothetical protein
MTESARNVWRRGIAPALSLKALQLLGNALEDDDPRLHQGLMSIPPPIDCLLSYPVERADALGLAGWLGEGLRTVGEVEAFVVGLYTKVDELMGEQGAYRCFLEWHDDTLREEMRSELLAEVRRSLAERLGITPAA